MKPSLRPVCLTALFALACGCAPNAVRRLSGGERLPSDVARLRLAGATSQAERAANATTPFWVVARLNRATCECPMWEVQVWGQWRRAALVWPAAGLDAAAEAERAADGTRLWVEVEESETVRASDGGRLFPQFAVLRTSAERPTR
jgi:hypothetical protein